MIHRRGHSRRRSYYSTYFTKKLKKHKILKSVHLTREIVLLFFFCFLFFVLVSRLFYLQIIKAKHYDTLLGNQHVSKSLLDADRGHIYAQDKSGKPVQLTDNIMMYNVFVDPKFLGDDENKQRFIDIVTPVFYQHLCETHGMETIDLLGCVENIEAFSQKDLLPQEPQIFYLGSGVIESVGSLDWTGFYLQKEEVLKSFTTGTAYSLIKERLNKRIYIGINPRNYLGFFSNTKFVDELKALNLPYVTVRYSNYVYIVPDQVNNIPKDSLVLKKLLDKYGYYNDYPNLEYKFLPQENRYVKLMSDLHPALANTIKELKLQYYKDRTRENIPILHGLGLEQQTRRYYPFGTFASHVLGYVDKNGQSFYGIEQYFDEVLAGENGEIEGRASAWIGQVGANDFEIKDVQHGDDVYLTLDIGMQKEIEIIAQNYHARLKADSVSILVYDPYEGDIKASVTSPGFNPNNYNEIYTLAPLNPEQWYIVDDETYVDVPVYIKTGGEYKIASFDERNNITLKKYIAKNMYGPQVFIDKNISQAYEPGSILKALTIGIGLDTDEVRFYDYYYDSGYVEIGPYTIKNVDKNCLGYKSFLNAFIYSCNVGMVRIAQKVGKENYYNYLSKLGFGQYSHIELANEDDGFVEGVSSVSWARYFNNTYGQGLEATPLQVAAGYGSLVNGGYYVKPSIEAGIRDKQTGIFQENKKKVVRQVFRKETSAELKNGLFTIMESNKDYIKNIRVEGFSLGGKSGTSQISYKGRYQQGLGWTNASFVGLLTKNDTRYIVVIQVRRPRTSLWGGETAGRIFRDVAKFLVSYSLIEG